MKKLLWTVFVLVILLIFIGLVSCIQTGDEERPGMRVSTDLLLTKVWQVNLFKDNGQDKTILFNDVFLEFRSNFIFKITKGCDIIEGEWILSSDSTLLVIRIPDGHQPLDQLDDEWVITWLTDSEMRFIEQDNKGDEEFHLSTAPLPAINCQSCENVVEILTDSIWAITSFTVGSNDMTEQTRGSYLDFNRNGDVILYHDYEELVGLWAITDNCQTLEIQWLKDQLTQDSYDQLASTWFIRILEQQYISLESNEEAALHMTKGRVPDCEDLHNSLLNTSWSIDYMAINEDDLSDNFSGTGFTFLENDQLATEVIVGPAILGEWMLDGNCDLLVVEIQAGQLTELSREWFMTSIEDDKITLVFEEGTLRMEMHLKRGKPEISSKCLELINYLTTGKWSVHEFTSDNQAVTGSFDGFQFEFQEDGGFVANNDQKEISGQWYPSKDCNYLVIEIDRNSVVSSISGVWKILNITDNGISLAFEKLDKKKTVELIRY